MPGFFRNSNGNYTFVNYDGIGIPIKDSLGRILAIQVRLKHKPAHGSRYIWFSSSKLPDGTGPGAPIDVCYPNTILKNEWTSNLFITEGKFKVQKLSKHTKSVGLSVQGVSSWRGIEETIMQAQKLHKEFKNIFICFDGDLSTNAQVNEQAKKLSDSIKDSFPNAKIFYCIWDPNIGKGIDDVIDNNALNQIKIIHKKHYDNLYLNMIKTIVNYSDKTNINDIRKLYSDFKETFNKLPKDYRYNLYFKYVYSKIPKKSA